MYKLSSLILLAGMLTSAAFAGGVKIDSAIDFSLKDANAIEHRLYEYLDAGKWVLLSFTGKS